MSRFVIFFFLAVFGICNVSSRDVPTNYPEAVKIVFRNRPPNYSCNCRPINHCNPAIFVARSICPIGQRCCLNDQPDEETNEIEPSGKPDTIPPPISVYIDKTPPNHSCHCGNFFDCISKIFVKNVQCEVADDICCLHVGPTLPFIRYPEVYRRIFGIEEYAYLHSTN